MSLVLFVAVLSGVIVFCLVLVLVYRGKPQARETENRALARLPVRTAVQVMWEDEQGLNHTVQGRAQDISEAGIRIKTAVTFTPGRVVNIVAPEYKLRAAGTVKYCRRVFTGYVIGVHFQGALSRTL